MVDAMAEGEMPRRFTGDIQGSWSPAPRYGNVPVRRRESHHHDASLFDQRPADRKILRREPQRRKFHGGVVPEKFLRCRGDQVRFVPQNRQLVGVTHQRHYSVAHEIHGCFMARDEEQLQHGKELLIRKSTVIVITGRDESRCEVVPGVLALFVDQSGQKHAKLHERRLALRCTDRKSLPRQPPESIALMLGKSDKLRDHGNGKRGGVLRHQVHFARRRPRVDQGIRYSFDSLAEFSYSFRCECSGYETSKASMVRGVGGEHVPTIDVIVMSDIPCGFERSNRRCRMVAQRWMGQGFTSGRMGDNQPAREA